MNTESLRLKLIEWISQLEDENILKRIDSFRRMDRTSWDNLSYEDKQAIEEGLEQLNEGNSVSYQEARNKIKSKLK
jgi:predicted transcriptional regulator